MSEQTEQRGNTMTDKPWCILSGEKACKLEPFLGRDDARIVLQGIHVEPHPDGGVLMVATNGISMGVYHDKLGSCSGPMSVRVRSELFRTVDTPFDDWGDPIDEYEPVISGAGRVIVCRDGITGAFHRMHDGYPTIEEIDFSKARALIPDGMIETKALPWANVFPYGGAGNADQCKTLRDNFGEKCPNIDMHDLTTISFNITEVRNFRRIEPDAQRLSLFLGETRADPIVVRAQSEPSFVGVIMPCRSTMDERLPAWLPG